MSDNDFLFEFENCTLLKEDFKHIGHLRVAWLYLSNYPFAHAYKKITQGILNYAKSLGAEQIYNETLTSIWIFRVYEALNSKDSNFVEFIEKNHQLFDKSVIQQFYSEIILQNPLAKTIWLSPDINLDDARVKHFINLMQTVKN